MPADPTVIKQMIDDDLSSNGNRLIKATGLRAVLKALADWVGSVAGVVGPQGPAGPTGHLDSLKIKGHYQNGANYITGDIVEYWPRKAYYQNGTFQDIIGGCFMAIAPTTGNAPVSNEGAIHASWKAIASSVSFPIEAEEDVVMVATGPTVVMNYCTRHIIIPKSLSSFAYIDIKLPTDTGAREHYKEPSSFTVHNGTNKIVRIKDVYGNLVPGWKSVSSLNAMDGGSSNLDNLDAGVWQLLKLGDPYFLNYFANKISI